MLQNLFLSPLKKSSRKSVDFMTYDKFERYFSVKHGPVEFIYHDMKIFKKLGYKTICAYIYVCMTEVERGYEQKVDDGPSL